MHARPSERRPSRQHAAAWLSGAGLRPTRQRLVLAELLVGDGRNRHVTAESLHEAARDQDAPVSLATVYNTLRAFCGAGLMHEVTVDGTRSYFDTRTDDHPHYFWEEDGRLTDAPNDASRPLRRPGHPRGRRARPHRRGDPPAPTALSLQPNASNCGRSSVISNHGAFDPTKICRDGRIAGASTSVPIATCTQAPSRTTE